MNININLTANLTADDVKAIVKAYLENNGYNVESLTPKLTKRTMGHQMNEYEETIFDGMDIKISENKNKTYSQYDR